MGKEILISVLWRLGKIFIEEVLEHVLKDVEQAPESTTHSEKRIKETLKAVKESKKFKDFNRRRSER